MFWESLFFSPAGLFETSHQVQHELRVRHDLSWPDAEEPHVVLPAQRVFQQIAALLLQEGRSISLEMSIELSVVATVYFKSHSELGVIQIQLQRSAFRPDQPRQHREASDFGPAQGCRQGLHDAAAPLFARHVRRRSAAFGVVSSTAAAAGVAAGGLFDSLVRRVPERASLRASMSRSAG